MMLPMAKRLRGLTGLTPSSTQVSSRFPPTIIEAGMSQGAGCSSEAEHTLRMRIAQALVE